MSPIKYKSSFESKADRFRRTDGVIDLTYTVDSGPYLTFAAGCTRSVLAFWCKLLFSYCWIPGSKATLTTSVEQSPQTYSTMRSPVPRFRPTTAPDTAHLGPGYVDPQILGPRCVNRAAAADDTLDFPTDFLSHALPWWSGMRFVDRPKSVVAQRSPRFEPDRPSQGGGSYDVDTGPKASVATSVSQVTSSLLAIPPSSVTRPPHVALFVCLAVAPRVLQPVFKSRAIQGHVRGSHHAGCHATPAV
jgi:hypothetical protein